VIRNLLRRIIGTRLSEQDHRNKVNWNAIIRSVREKRSNAAAAVVVNLARLRL